MAGIVPNVGETVALELIVNSNGSGGSGGGLGNPGSADAHRRRQARAVAASCGVIGAGDCCQRRYISGTS